MHVVDVFLPQLGLVVAELGRRADVVLVQRRADGVHEPLECGVVAPGLVVQRFKESSNQQSVLTNMITMYWCGPTCKFRMSRVPLS